MIIAETIFAVDGISPMTVIYDVRRAQCHDL